MLRSFILGQEENKLFGPPAPHPSEHSTLQNFSISSPVLLLTEIGLLLLTPAPTPSRPLSMPLSLLLLLSPTLPPPSTEFHGSFPASGFPCTLTLQFLIQERFQPA